MLVVGAGPAGLATALELTRHGGHPLVVDSNAQPGGLARTIWKDGYGFDLGPHRFFTKSDEINQLWAEILGSDLLVVDRQTRIFYRGKYFSYPLRPFEALSKLGLVTSVRAVWSYVSSRIRNRKTEPRNFEEWVINEFGKVLYEIFFKSYTEKVWGVPCAEIGKEWAGQRIRGLNLASAIKDGFRRGGDAQVRSLVDHFYYPRRGAGQFYDRMKSTIEGKGGEVRLSSTVIEANHDGERITSVVCEPGDVSTPIDHIFVSAPITRWVESLNPPPPSEILSASRSLTYRSHITVNLLIEGSPPFDDNWIYVHAPDLQMARVANYRSFSPDMAPGSEASPLSVEYFCFESDELWTKSDDGLIQLATRELELAGLL
ncbi:MAG: hypothetical protein QOG04_1956, partial [Actinomycetota bacterium]|nr:hypothetical protein [Actinomycetota bacterium]